jgi:hypothetical protein
MFRDGLGREIFKIKWLAGGRVQILCTQVLLFSHFRSHEIAAGGRRMQSILAGLVGTCAIVLVGGDATFLS